MLTTYCTTLAMLLPVGSTPSISDYILFDYRDSISGTANLQAYHTWLIDWCASHPPPRLVLYVSSPCSPLAGAFGEFYDPTASKDDTATAVNFVDFLVDLKAAVPSVDVECFISNGSYPDNSATSPCWSATTTTKPTLPLPTDWSGLPLFLDWMDAIVSNPDLSSAAPVGMAMDPEFEGAIPSNLCTAAQGSTVIYQQLIDYIDAWRVLNGHQSIRSGMTFQVDTATFSVINVSDWPLTTEMTGMLPSTSPELDCQLNGAAYPPWRTSSDTAPLLDTVYMQVYVGSLCSGGTISTASTFWRWQNEHGCQVGVTPVPRTPAEAAESLYLNMVQKAGSPGPGTIKVVDAGLRDDGSYLSFTGTNTLFGDWAQYSRVRCTKPDGSTLPSVAQWKLKGIDSDTTATGYGMHESTDGASLPYTYTELLFNWQSPAVSTALTNRVVFMFSAEKEPWYPFFGWWTLQNFLQFTADFAGWVDGSDADHAIYLDAAGAPLSMPMPFCLYSLKQACDSWGIGTYPGSSSNGTACAANLAGTSTVGMESLLLMLTGWGTPMADIDGSNDSSAADIHLLLSVWGQSCESPDLSCP